jgi:hypothetical protein
MSGLREADLREADNVRAAGLRSARQGIVRGVAEEDAEFTHKFRIQKDEL